MKFIIGKKLGMTQVFGKDGSVIPVTRVQAGPCVVTQVKIEKEKEGVEAVQIGFGQQKMFRLTKPLKGHLKDINVVDDKNITVRFLHDFKNDNELKRGDKFTVSIFEPGEKVQVTGKSKGRGFQGVVKRHGFHGSPASHGHKDQLRMPGSIGATDAARVFKGTRMAGHMGDAQVTIKNLEVIEVKSEDNEILLKGAVPGARNGLVYIFTQEGNIKIDETKVEEKTLEGNIKAEVEENKEQKAGTESETKKDAEPVEKNVEEKKKKVEVKEGNKKEDNNVEEKSVEEKVVKIKDGEKELSADAQAKEENK